MSVIEMEMKKEIDEIILSTKETMKVFLVHNKFIFLHGLYRSTSTRNPG